MSRMRIVRTYVQDLKAPPAEVFPLICPVREAEWLDGFQFEMVYSGSGVAEPFCMFTTESPGEPTTVWTIIEHDREAGRIAFLRVTPEHLVTHLSVGLEAAANDRTDATITYTFTSLGPKGDALLEGRHSEKGFTEMVQIWEKALNHFLGTGEKLKLG